MNKYLFTSLLALSVFLIEAPDALAGRNGPSPNKDEPEAGAANKKPWTFLSRRKGKTKKTGESPEEKENEEGSDSSSTPPSSREESSDLPEDLEGVMDQLTEALEGVDRQLANAQKPAIPSRHDSPNLIDLLTGSEGSTLFEESGEQPVNPVGREASTESNSSESSPEEESTFSVPNDSLYNNDEEGDLATQSSASVSESGEEKERKLSGKGEETSPAGGSPAAGEESPDEKDDFTEDLLERVPPKTWWETLWGADKERLKLFTQLQIEQGIMHILNKAKGEGVTVKGKRGVPQMEAAILKNLPSIQATLEEDRREARRVIREILSASENESTSSLTWYWRWMGYKDKETEVYLDTDEAGKEKEAPESADPASEALADEQIEVEEEEELEDTIYGEDQTIALTSKVSGYLDSKTPVADWDPSTLAWFWQEGEGKEFTIHIQDEDNPLSVAMAEEEEERPSLSTSKLTILVEMKVGADHVIGLFQAQVEKYLREETFVGYWAPNIWDYVKREMTNTPEIVSEEQFAQFSQDRDTYFKALDRLKKETLGHQWETDVWAWFAQHGADIDFPLDADTTVKGAERLATLRKNREVPEGVKLNLRRLTPPHRWKSADWEWFRAHALDRVLETILINEDLYRGLSEQRNGGVNLSYELDFEFFPAFGEMLHPEPTFDEEAGREYIRTLQTVFDTQKKPVDQWSCRLIPTWDLDLVKWLHHKGRTHLFTLVTDTGETVETPLDMDSFFTRRVESQLAIPSEEGAGTKIDGAAWDDNTAYWFEVCGKGRTFSVGGKPLEIDDELHRAFLMERQWIPLIAEILRGDFDFAEIPDEASEWLLEKAQTGFVVHYPVDDPRERYMVNDKTVGDLYGQVVSQYIHNNIPAHEWATHAWRWLENQWSENAKAVETSSGGSCKVLHYHVEGYSEPMEMWEGLYSTLFEERGEDS